MVRQGNDDDRLDALERAFVALRSELRVEMDQRFDRVEVRLGRVDDQFAELRNQFMELRAEVSAGAQSTQQTIVGMQQTIIELQRTIIRVGAGLGGTVVASLIAALLAGHF